MLLMAARVISWYHTVVLLWSHAYLPHGYNTYIRVSIYYGCYLQPVPSVEHTLCDYESGSRCPIAGGIATAGAFETHYTTSTLALLQAYYHATSDHPSFPFLSLSFHFYFSFFFLISCSSFLSSLQVVWWAGLLWLCSAFIVMAFGVAWANKPTVFATYISCLVRCDRRACLSRMMHRRGHRLFCICTQIGGKYTV